MRKFRVILWLVSSCALAAEQRGEVTFGGLPVPGATITATRGSKQAVAISDAQGFYVFPDLKDGVWKIRVEMTGFAPVSGEITVAPNTAPAKWELKLLPIEQIQASAAPVPVQPVPRAGSPQTEEGLLVNGSENNGAASAFAQMPAFGNFRKGARGLYNGGIGFQ